MLRSLFGKGKKRRGSDAAAPAQDDSIRAAKVGDVLSIQGFALEYDDLFFYVERIHRYSNDADTWYELTCVDGDTQIWIDWTEGFDLFVTATDGPDPVGLSSVGLTEEQLIALDEENSIDNNIEVDGAVFNYRNSSEVTFYQDNRGEGQGYYHWDFLRDDGERALSVSKWEGKPFEVVFSDVIDPDSIKLYKAGPTEQANRRSR